MLMQPMMPGFSPNSVTADVIQQMAAQRISQTTELDAPGYIHLDTYELKKHRQLRTILCGRCKLLSHGHMITAVGGNGGYSGGKQFVSSEELREKPSHLRHEKALIVKLHVWQRSVMGNPCPFSTHAWIFHVWLTTDFKKKDTANPPSQLFMQSYLPPSDSGNPSFQGKAELQCGLQ